MDRKKVGVVMEKYLQEFERWLASVNDPEVKEQLLKMKGDEKLIEDAFYRDLAFGTGGLRGELGAGTNRMKVYTVRKASQGLANYINHHFKNPSIAISYDSRINSTLFAKAAAGVFAANGIKVFIYKELMPTPLLSYAVRTLKCSSGIMVTASHNPSKYNGYKAYDENGCQIANEVADETLDEINHLDIFKDIKYMDFEEALAKGMASYISEDVYTAFIERVKQESVLFGEEVNRDVKIVYSPLNGTGLKPVTRILRESGYKNVIVVKEQEQPDGQFPTCPYPNTEIKEAMALGIEYAKKNDADLLIATDPDCDRVGIAVKNSEGEHVLLSGNQTGILLLDYICSMRQKHNKMPKDAMFVKTIVTSEMAKKVGENYGVRVVDVLTGFKYIGEQIKLLEDKNSEESYILGFEESYGYLTGSYVRDKDAVDGVFMIVEMFAYYKTRGISLLDKLDELYKKYGYYSNYLNSFEFPGSSGFAKMTAVMEHFRNEIKAINGVKVETLLDYSKGINGLPKSNVIKMYLEDGSIVIARPSGTEPKLKIYTSITGPSVDANDKKYASLLEAVKEELK